MGVAAQLTADQRTGATIWPLADGALKCHIRHSQSLILCSCAVLVIQQQAAVHQVVLGVAVRCANGCAVQRIQIVSCQHLRIFNLLVGEFDSYFGNCQIKSIHGNGIIGITGQVDEASVTGHGCAANIAC